MFTVETVVTEREGKIVRYYWKKDRTYKVFENAEKRLYSLYAEGITARMVERK